jgi:hypothetical protein
VGFAIVASVQLVDQHILLLQLFYLQMQMMLHSGIVDFLELEDYSMVVEAR